MAFFEVSSVISVISFVANELSEIAYRSRNLPDEAPSTTAGIDARLCMGNRLIRFTMNGTGGWVGAGIGTKSRRLEVDGLVPGSTYQLQVRAIGGSTGTGAWSDPVSHMAT